ncbi:MAG: hypothetical protein RJA81_1807 [Planctomycetota bacterium]
MSSAWLATYEKDPVSAWSQFEPSKIQPWDWSSAAHLHRRAAFGGTVAEIQESLSQGPEQAVFRILHGNDQAADGTPAAAYLSFADRIDAKLGPDGPLRRIQALWLQRMVDTPRPAEEWLTVFWHNHFATSDVKVKNTGQMVRQITTIRKHTFGPFQVLLDAIAKDPAMLVWLDASANRRSRPNENFAREVMELFTLGRGNYSEKDIQEAARAYTGWFVIRDQFAFLEQQHDSGSKQVLGQTGPFHGEEIHEILVKQPACGSFLSRKLLKHYVSESDTFNDRLIQPLVETFRDSGGSIEVLVRKILGSRLFHDPAARRRRVKSPVEFIVGMCRTLEISNPMPPPELLADSSAAMGQALYAPPSVAGWDGGVSWIDTTRLVARTNLSLGICSQVGPFANKLNLKAWAEKYNLANPAEATETLVNLLLGDGATDNFRKEMNQMAREHAADLRPVLARILTEPVYQLA